MPNGSAAFLRGITTTKLEKFLENCEYDPSPVLEYIKEQLAHGGSWRDLVDQWNEGIASFLLASGVEKGLAIEIRAATGHVCFLLFYVRFSPRSGHYERCA